MNHDRALVRNPNERLSLRPASLVDAAYVAEHMKVADVDELWELHREGPFGAMARAVKVSREVHAACWDGTPVAIYGVYTTTLGNHASPWFFSTPQTDSLIFPMVRQVRPVVQQWRQEFDLLENLVSAKNTRTISWLRALGFEIGKPHQIANGAEACVFRMEKASV